MRNYVRFNGTAATLTSIGLDEPREHAAILGKVGKRDDARVYRFKYDGVLVDCAVVEFDELEGPNAEGGTRPPLCIVPVKFLEPACGPQAELN